MERMDLFTITLQTWEEDFNNKEDADKFFADNKDRVTLYTHIVINEKGQRIPVDVFHWEVDDSFWK